MSRGQQNPREQNSTRRQLYERDAESWSSIGDRHVLNGDNAAANVAYTVATENRIAADLEK